MPLDLPGTHKWGWQADHITPLARGGNPWDLNNIAPSHGICNNLKGANGHRLEPKPRTEGGSRNWSATCQIVS